MPGLEESGASSLNGLNVLNQHYDTLDDLLAAGKDLQIDNEERLVDFLTSAVAQHRGTDDGLCTRALENVSRLANKGTPLGKKIGEIARQNTLAIAQMEPTGPIAVSSVHPQREALRVKTISQQDFREQLFSCADTDAAAMVIAKGFMSFLNPGNNLDLGTLMRLYPESTREEVIEKVQPLICREGNEAEAITALHQMAEKPGFRGDPSLIRCFTPLIESRPEVRNLVRAVAGRSLSLDNALPLVSLLYPDQHIETKNDLFEAWAQELSQDPLYFEEWLQATPMSEQVQQKMLEKIQSLSPDKSAQFERVYDFHQCKTAITQTKKSSEIKQEVHGLLNKHPELHESLSAWNASDLSGQKQKIVSLLIDTHHAGSHPGKLVQCVNDHQGLVTKDTPLSQYLCRSKMDKETLVQLYTNPQLFAFLPLPDEKAFNEFVGDLVHHQVISLDDVLVLCDSLGILPDYSFVETIIGQEGDLDFIRALIERGVTFQDAYRLKIPWSRHWPEEYKSQLLALLEKGQFPFDKLVGSFPGLSGICSSLDPNFLESVMMFAGMEKIPARTAMFVMRYSKFNIPEEFEEPSKALADFMRVFCQRIEIEKMDDLDTIVSVLALTGNIEAMQHIGPLLGDQLAALALQDEQSRLVSKVKGKKRLKRSLNKLSKDMKKKYPGIARYKVTAPNKRSARKINRLEDFFGKMITRDNPQLLRNFFAVSKEFLALMVENGDMSYEELLFLAMDKNAMQAADVILEIFGSEMSGIDQKLFNHLYESHNLNAAIHLQKKGLMGSREELISQWTEKLLSDFGEEQNVGQEVPKGLQRELIALYLRSDLPDFMDIVSELSERNEKLHKPLDDFVEQLLISGTQVAKDRAFHVAKKLGRVYGALESDHYFHQLEFGTESYRQVQFLSDLSRKEGRLSLESIMTYFSYWRGDLATQMRDGNFQQYYTAKTEGCDTGFYSNPKSAPSRYSIYESNFSRTIGISMQSDPVDSDAGAKFERDYDGHPTVSIRWPAIVTDIEWNALDSMSYLEPVHQRMCSLDASQMSAMEFHREALEAYYDLMSANFLSRGSAHIMQMMTGYWYASHGFAPPQMPFELGFLDCQVLSLSSKEEFIESCLESFGSQPLRPLSEGAVAAFSETSKEQERLARCRKLGLFVQGGRYTTSYIERVQGKV